MMLVGFLAHVCPVCMLKKPHPEVLDMWQALTSSLCHAGVDDAQGASLLKTALHFHWHQPLRLHASLA